MKLDQQSFGYWLKLKRKSLDLTRAQLASRLGYSAATIHKLETEQRRPSEQIISQLAEIFSIPPDERPAFLRFARGSLESVPADTKEIPPWQPAERTIRSNLPAATTTLIGREKEIANIHKYLLNPDIRLATLVGPPGIGKTRLSIESARDVLPDFPDGIYFVALAPLNDPSLIASTIIQALGFVQMNNHTPLQQLILGIRQKKMLVVLDNCEHVIREVVALITELLAACPRLKVLTTSRESLRLTGEWVYPVAALDMPQDGKVLNAESASQFPALRLFSERASAVRPDFVINSDNLDSVIAICAQLDGLPLAIELIAARVRIMSPQELLKKLDERLVLSANGMRALSARHKTLESAIRWSYILLTKEEQELFTYLSVFPGTFTPEVAEGILSKYFKEKSVHDLMTSLQDKSLLQRQLGAEGRDESRFSQLVTIRNFALDRLRSTGKESEIRDDHLSYFLELTSPADHELRRAGQIEWLHRLETLRPDLHAALDWAIKTGQTQNAMQLAFNIDWFWFIRSLHSDGRGWLLRVSEMPEIEKYPEAHAGILNRLAYHTFLLITPREAQPYAEQALTIARAHADKHNIAWALVALGLFSTFEGSYSGVQAIEEESLALFRELHDDWWSAHTVFALGFLERGLENSKGALNLLHRSLVEFEKLGDRYFKSVVLHEIAKIYILNRDSLQGESTAKQALTLAQLLGSTYEVANNFYRLGEAAQIAGRPSRAVRLLWASRSMHDLVGSFQPEDEPAFEKALAPCHSELSEAEFTLAMEQGRAMTMEQAIAYALNDEDLSD